MLRWQFRFVFDEKKKRKTGSFAYELPAMKLYVVRASCFGMCVLQLLENFFGDFEV